MQPPPRVIGRLMAQEAQGPLERWALHTQHLSEDNCVMPANALAPIAAPTAVRIKHSGTDRYA